MSLAIAVVLALSVSGCTASTPVVGRMCTLDAKAVPSCGVLWGVSTQPRSVRHLHALERTLDRPFDFVYHYLDVNGRFPDQVERREAAEGRLLHIAIAARDFQGARGKPVSWAAIARGDFDRALSAQARGVASLPAPVFVTFAQEGNTPKKLGVDGTPADFKAAWRHLVTLYKKAGASNAVWTWVMAGSTENLRAAASLWPGNDVVDWISWNVYNRAGCTRGGDVSQLQSFEDRMRIFYDFVHQRGDAIGMDVDKPMMISEAGSTDYASDQSLTADWYAAIPSTLQKYPQIKAVTLWDSVTDTCDFQFSSSPTVVKGVRRAGLDPALDIRGALTVRTDR